MALFNKLNTPVFLKEVSDTTQYINRLKELQDRATGKVKDDIAREINLANYGEIGEKNIAFELKNSGMPMYIIHDLRLEFEELSAQIDYVVVTRKLVFLIECKNLFGNIDVDNQGNFVRKYSWNGRTIKEGVYSPITQNQRHLDVLKQMKRADKKNAITKMLLDKHFGDFHKSIVVLANPKTVLNVKYAKRDVKDKIIRGDQLIQYIKDALKKSKELTNSDTEMEEWAQRLLALHIPNQTDYAKKFEDLIDRVTNDSEKEAVIEKTADSMIDKASLPPVVEKPIIVNETMAEYLAPADNKETLIKQLKAYRLEKSREENIKAYCVFSNKQMLDLIDKMPKSRDELLGVSGFGPVKAEKYGDVIIELLK